MSKTAMQELIEWIKDYEDGYIFYGVIMDEAIELLNKEKEQIMDAFKIGMNNGMGSGTFFDSEYYYQKTYNHE